MKVPAAGGGCLDYSKHERTELAMTLDPRYRTIISNIANAVPMTSRRENLPLGTHEVAICRYQPRLGQMNTGYRLEATFLIVSSDQPSISPSTVRDWAWFPESPGI